MHIPTPAELKARREELGLSQTELARKAGISQSMVARIETGSVDPRVSTMTKIIRVLAGVDRPRITASRIMHTPVISIGAATLVTDAVTLMQKKGISQLPVIEEGTPIGCISESAIVAAVEERRGHRHMHPPLVRDYLEPGFPTVPPEADVETVIRLLEHHHAVLVMAHGHVAGVITKHDLIPLMAPG